MDGSCRASHASFVIVRDATGTDPHAFAHRSHPPADRVAELASRRFHRAIEVGTYHGGSVLRYHDADARLDLGSIAKGYGVDRAVTALRRHGIEKALVVAGGDLYALGTAPYGEPWSIGIQSPTDERALSLCCAGSYNGAWGCVGT